MLFVNLSNHPSGKWEPAQREAALAMGSSILDVPFPEVPPEADEAAVARLAEQVCASVPAEAACAMVMGEFTLTVEVVARLRRRGICCVAATSRRHVEELPDGRKVVHFQFVRFRRYGSPGGVGDGNPSSTVGEPCHTPLPQRRPDRSRCS